MKNLKTFLKNTVIAVALAGVSIVATPVVEFGSVENVAEARINRVIKERPKQKAAPQVTQPFFRVYEKIQEALDVDDFAAASKLIDRILTSKAFNSYEKALGHQFRANIYYEQDDIPGAIREYEAFLATPGVPYATKDSIQFNLAQFYTMQEEYEKALALILDWMQYQPTLRAVQWVSIGQIYYQIGTKHIKTNKARGLESYRKAIPYIEEAIEMANADLTIEIRENWYELQYVLYYELGEFIKVKDILELMIVRWPRPRYWVQLSMMYSELEEEEKQTAVMDVAYRLGFITSETNLVSVAQLYMISAPYLSSKVLEKGLDENCEDACIDPEKVKNQKLLGQAFLNSKDFAKAGKPLGLAAAEEENGDLWFQLGVVYIQLEDWDNAINAFTKAIAKGDLRQEGQAHLRLGTAYFNKEEFKKAEDAFKEARKFKDLRRNANGWIEYIGAEKARIRRLAAAGLR